MYRHYIAFQNLLWSFGSWREHPMHKVCANTNHSSRTWRFDRVQLSGYDRLVLHQVGVRSGSTNKILKLVSSCHIVHGSDSSWSLTVDSQDRNGIHVIMDDNESACTLGRQSLKTWGMQCGTVKISSFSNIRQFSTTNRSASWLPTISSGSTTGFRTGAGNGPSRNCECKLRLNRSGLQDSEVQVGIEVNNYAEIDILSWREARRYHRARIRAMCRRKVSNAL
jgi:hypothetical protein